MFNRYLTRVPEQQSLQGEPSYPIRRLRFVWGTFLWMFFSCKIWDVEFDTPRGWDNTSIVDIKSLFHSGRYLVTEQKLVGNRVKMNIRKIGK